MRLRRLKEIRLENNLTQKDIAEILNIERSTYASFEIGRDTIPIEKLNIFINHFDLSFDYMLDLDEKRKKGTIIRTDFDKVLIGNRLKNTRIDHKLTQDLVGKILNTDHSVWSRYEHGVTLINVPFLYAYACKIKISADYLIGRIDRKYRINPLVVIESKDEYALNY